MKRAFTLIELLVVMAIIVILTAVAIPAIKSLTKNNGQAQAVNQIRAMLSNARATAISQHRKAGVVFFDETPEFTKDIHSNQTAMMLFVEDYNQTQYAPAQGVTVYVTYTTDRQYLPAGVMVGALGVDGTTGFESMRTGDNSAAGVGTNCRCVLFDTEGQMLGENKMATPLKNGNYSAADVGLLTSTHPTGYGDWRFSDPSNTGHASNPWIPSNAISETAFFVFDKNEYNTQSFGTGVAAQNNKTIWLEQHATPIVINAYTGGVIR